MRGPRELGLSFPKNLLEHLGEGMLRTSHGANHGQHNLFLLPHLEGISNLHLQLLLSPSYAQCPLYSRLTEGLGSQGLLSEFQLRVAKQGLDSPLAQDNFYFPVSEKQFFSAIYFCG